MQWTKSRTIVSLTLLYVLGPTAIAQRPLPELFPRVIGVAKIDPEVLDASPRWSALDENPPVSARAALGLAIRERKRFDKTIEYDRDRYRWVFHSIVLVPPSRHGNWYWLAKFDFKDLHRSGASMPGMPEQVEIPILMNGRAVKLRSPEPPAEKMDLGLESELD